jgi:hypothetical protein
MTTLDELGEAELRVKIWKYAFIPAVGNLGNLYMDRGQLQEAEAIY